MAEPVTLSMARAQCSIDDGDTTFDALLTAYIAAARDWVERYTGHILLQRDIVETLAGYPTCPRWIELTYRPVETVDEIAYTDSDSAAQEFTDFVATLGRYPVRIYEGAGASWPTTLDNSVVNVTYTAGYAPGDEPPALMHAMLLLVGTWFLQRETIVVGQTVDEVPFAVTALCDIYRVPWL